VHQLYSISDLGRSMTVTSTSHVRGWSEADASLRGAMDDGEMLAKAQLRSRFPGATIRTEHFDPPPDAAPAPLVVQVSALHTVADWTAVGKADLHDFALIRGEDDPLLAHLAACVPIAHSIDIAVAFVMDGGVERIRPYLEDLLARGGRLRLLTGDYMDATEPDGLESLLDLQGDRTLRVFESRGRSFHPKSYIFRWHNEEGTAFVGSSNLSRTALESGVEWNYRVISSRDQAGFQSVRDAFERLFANRATVELTHDWVQAYRARRRTDASRPAGVLPEPVPPPEPHGIQLRALEALQQTRAEGNRAGLVVLATGLGKTWLSAFDSRAFQRVLFVAHREEILEQALNTFRRIRPTSSLGRYMGQQRDADAEILFASVQTLSRVAHLQRFTPDRFDYIVVDEFHHADSETYRRILERFMPQFLLGLTATPERTDGADLLALCGHNLVFRCDLVDGVRDGLLCPFAYFGVPDDIDYQQVPWRRTSFDEAELTRQVATEARAQNALEQLGKHGGKRVLGFCVSQRHADFMREFFRARGKRAASVHAGSSADPRVNSMDALRRGDLDVVFCVDMFNEGLDVPEIDTVLMLRPTESRILWLQQFGRGLRRLEGKTLRVIDYIGNHKTFLDKPRALLGALIGLGDSPEELRAALMKARDGDLDLPPGCSVTYDVEAIDVLSKLLPKRDALQRIEALYVDFRERKGRRPSAGEMYAMDRDAIRVAATHHRSWFAFVSSKSDMSDGERRVTQSHGDFFDEVANSKMERSYKMLVLQAMMELSRMPGDVSINDLADRFTLIASRSPALRSELEVTLAGGVQLPSMLKSEPLRAWAGTKRGRGSDWFRIRSDRFEAVLDVQPEDREAFLAMLAELVDWRIRQHVDTIASPVFECRVASNGREPILFLPDRARHPGIPHGQEVVHSEGDEFRADFAKIAINRLARVVDPSGENALPELLRYWFGPDAGQPGHGQRVRLRAASDGIHMEPAVDQSPKHAVSRLDGHRLDAHFHVESTGRRAAVVYYSRYGTDRTKGARNIDYATGLELLLARAKDRSLRLVDALLDSEPARQQPVSKRRLPQGDITLPLDLNVATSTEAVRAWLQRAQRELSRSGQSNATRQIRLVFELPQMASANEVVQWLSGSGDPDRQG
jgi:superfamily II DNA or RNA helicase